MEFLPNKLVLFGFDGVFINTHQIRVMAPEIAGENRLLRPKLLELPLEHGLKDVTGHLVEEYTLGIISNTNSQLISEYLDTEDMNHRFLEIYGDNHGTDLVEKMSALLKFSGHSPLKTLHITDDPRGIEEARKIGIISIAVTWGHHTDEELLVAKPAALVSTAEDLEVAIRRLLP